MSPTPGPIQQPYEETISHDSALSFARDTTVYAHAPAAEDVANLKAAYLELREGKDYAELLARLGTHIRVMAPHQKTREAGVLLIEAAAAIRGLQLSYTAAHNEFERAVADLAACREVADGLRDELRIEREINADISLSRVALEAELKAERKAREAAEPEITELKAIRAQFAERNSILFARDLESTQRAEAAEAKLANLQSALDEMTADSLKWQDRAEAAPSPDALLAAELRGMEKAAKMCATLAKAICDRNYYAGVASFQCEELIRAEIKRREGK